MISGSKQTTPSGYTLEHSTAKNNEVNSEGSREPLFGPIDGTHTNTSSDANLGSDFGNVPPPPPVASGNKLIKKIASKFSYNNPINKKRFNNKNGSIGATTTIPLVYTKDAKVNEILRNVRDCVHVVNENNHLNYLQESFADSNLSVERLFQHDRNRQHLLLFTIVNNNKVADEYPGTFEGGNFYNKSSKNINCKDAIDGWEDHVEKAVLKAFWWQGAVSVTIIFLRSHGLNINYEDDVLTACQGIYTSCRIDFSTQRVTITSPLRIVNRMDAKEQLLPLELELTFKFKLSEIAENKMSEIIDNSQIEEGNKNNAIHEALISLKPQELIDFSETRLNMTQKSVEDIQRSIPRE